MNLLKSSFFLILILTFIGCKQSTPEQEVRNFVDPSYGAYVSSYTAGTISSNSPVTIHLTQEVTDDIFTNINPTEIISIEPAVEGEAYWLDKATIEFKPLEKLQSGTTYTVRFNLGKVTDVPDALSYLQYLIQTLKQNYDVTVENLETEPGTDLRKMNLVGQLQTADMANSEDVKRILTPRQGDNKLEISWEHSSDGVSHRFVVSGIERMESESEVTLNLSGEAIGSERSEELNINIPALGDFKLISAQVEQSGEQHILLRFSDPIKESQNLDGIIRVGRLSNLSFDIKGNEIRVYPSVRQTGTQSLSISPGLRNILDYRLQKEIVQQVAFEQLKPEVRFTGNGNIIAGNSGAVLPFEAVNLNSVVVTIIKVYQDNISQFLQVNNMDGNREIRRVGRPVFRRIVKLEDGVTDMSKWNRFTLDLSEFIKADPGALYQVNVGFRKQHSAYSCPGQEQEELTTILEQEDYDAPGTDEFSYWDYNDDYYYYDDWDWYERDNPCSDSYYGDRRTIKRNIIASNLGIIAKMGTDRKMFVSVTDIKTTQPISSVDLKVFNYQQQEIGNGFTDANGFCTIETSGQPFLVIADDGNQKGYIKVDDGSSLSMSTFDVGGVSLPEGIKGFLYGERGVWRPGDSLHLSFILEDKNELIPEDHPVIFELTDPMGKLQKRIVSTYSVNNFYRFSTKTESSSPTGNWNARVSIGNAQFNKRIKIETVKPNRLKINLDFGRDRITASDPVLNGKLNVSWLHGAPARNLKAEFEVVLSGSKTRFNGYEEYSFDNLEDSYYSESFPVFEGNLNQNGEATITSRLVANNNPPGVVNATFLGKVFEEGGNFSIKNLTIPFYPYDRFVGLKVPKGDKARGMLLTDTTHRVDIVTLDSEGKVVNSSVSVELYKVDWRWWWDNSSYGANYVSDSYKKLLEKSTVNTTGGKGSWNFQIEYPDWGRYYIKACDNNSGHCSGKVIYVDWPGWAGRAQRDNPGGASMLAFSTDKNSYEKGETIKVNIPGSGTGRALISLETGSRILQSYWLETKKGENQFVIEATQDMSPGVYVNVTMLQEHAQTINDLPIRMYGVIPVKVNDPDSRLEPRITMQDVLSPGKPVELKISEANGKKMTYTVAVVDEGLLDLTNFNTPDPWSNFFAREALGVKSWDLFGNVMGAYGARLERLLALGGDGDLETENKPDQANRFKPVVKYLGPFSLKEGQTATHSFIMPQYVGSVKTMIVAGNEGAYGSTEKATPVRQPLMILGTLPRVLGPGEKFILPVNVFAMEENVRDVTVSVQTNDLLSAVSSETKRLSFNQVGDKMTYFEYEVAPELGKGTVRISATGSGFSTQQDIEIQVRNANPPVTHFKDNIIEAGNSWTSQYEAHGIAGTNSGYIEVSSIPPVDLSRRLRYLIQYPHGCIEQTTSSVFPQLYLSDIIELSEKQKSETESNVKAGIRQLRQFQLNNGAFSYWPGSSEESEWGTIYAGHFLIEAKNRGYDVPASMLRSWRTYTARMVSRWRKNVRNRHSDMLQAYRLYTLALEGSPETGAMNRLRESNNLSELGAWRLAAAYAIAGQDKAARDLTVNRSMVVSQYREQGNTFGSALRDRAMILETLALLKEYTKAAPIIQELSGQLSANSWLSTQTTAYALIAIGKYLGSNKSGSELNFDFTVNGESKNGKSSLPVIQIPLDVTSSPNGTVKIDNKGDGLLYSRIVLTGSPLRGTESGSQNGLNLLVNYRDKDGGGIDIRNLEQGEEFIAEVTIRHTGLTGNYENLALTQIFPSGWEIVNSRLVDVSDSQKNSNYTYQDIRDDRVYTYFDLNRNQSKTFRVNLIASFSGDYYLPAVSCEAMYDQAVSATIAGMDVNVSAPGIQ